MCAFRKKKTKIGELLLQLDFITPEQLRKAVEFQVKEGKDKPLGQIMFDFGYVDMEKLCFALSIQSGYAYINIKNCKIDLSLLPLLPEVVVRKHLVFPIDKIQDVVTVAMSNPLDQDAFNQIKHFINSTVLVFLTTSDELREMIKMYYGLEV